MSNKIVIGLCAAFVLVVSGILYIGPHAYERVTTILAATACEAEMSGEEKIDCWLAISFDLVRKSGLDAGFRVFTYLYDTYPLFASTGCHRHAHKIGDVAYYEFYVARSLKLSDIRFPQETTTCGYGFFHGFIEHMVQDTPDMRFVVDTCEYLRSTYAEAMRDIGTICYHASGHGFMQAQADNLSQDLWGNPEMLVSEPLKMCERLPTDEKEIEDCREGVFNVLVDWTDTGNYGLSFDLDDPLALCSQVEDGWRYACYYELGQNLGVLIGDSPQKAAEFALSIADDELRTMTFGVMVAGMMQRNAALNEYKDVLAECAAIEDDALYSTCVVSAANGMMEHGAPGEEYVKVLDLCADDSLRPRGGDGECYSALAQRLARFYIPGKRKEICARFPYEHRPSCEQMIP